MCTTSMVSDHYRDMWKPMPWYPSTLPAAPFPDYKQIFINQPEITRVEFDELKRQVSEMVELLKRAKKYDEDNGEPGCEMDEKMEILRKVAKLVGVDLDAVIGAQR